MALIAVPAFAHAQSLGAGYPNPGSTGSAYTLNNTNPSAGITVPGSSYPSTIQQQSPSQFSPSGTKALYGNYGSDYRPELPANVYEPGVATRPAKEKTPQEGE